LQRSGFALVQSELLSRTLQEKALVACADLLREPGAETHPSDPKRYKMLKRSELDLGSEARNCTSTADGTSKAKQALLEYWLSLQQVKAKVLRQLAEGLYLPADFFVERHATENDSLRLLHYPPAPSSGNRCKEHSDYGSITLLTADDVVGLEFWSNEDEAWLPMPSAVADPGQQRGVLVLNAGSLLNGWTQGAIKATLHRVAGPASLHSRTPKKLLEDASLRDRHSLAFFVDLDPDVSLFDVASGGGVPEGVSSVADYVRWRCGAGGDGVNFASGERPADATICSPK